MARGRPIRLGPPSAGFYAVSSPLLSPDRTLCSGKNVYIRKQDYSVAVRPGLQLISSISSTNYPVISGTYFASENWNRVVVAVTSGNEWYASIDDGEFVNISSSSLLQEVSHTSFVPFFYDSKVWIHGCNGKTGILRWNTSQSQISEISGSPVLHDMTLCAGRIIGIDAVNFSVRWSAVNDPTVWPANAYFVLPSMGKPVTIKPLTRNIVAVFTESDIYLIYPAGNTDATAFRFEYFGTSSPPLSPVACFNFSNVLYYLTPDNVVYFFDGSSIRRISAPIENVTRRLTNVRAWLSGDISSKYVFLGYPKDGTCIVFPYDVETNIWNPPWIFPYEITVCTPALIVRGYTWGDLSSWTWGQLGLRKWEEFTPRSFPGIVLIDVNGKEMTLSGSTDTGSSLSWSFVFNPIVSDPSLMFSIDMVEAIMSADPSTPVTIRLGLSYDLMEPIMWETAGQIQREKAVKRNLDAPPVRVIMVECSGTSYIDSAICGANVYVYEKKVYL
ncbi:MAG: hypothetical protein QXT26_06575 [Thermoproteota archaeon]